MEAEDQFKARRRIRGRGSIRLFEVVPGVSEDEESKEERLKKSRIASLIEEEMKLLIEEAEDIATEEIKILGKLKKMIEEPTQEEEILQTKIISPKEVSAEWEKWLPAIRAEIDSLIREKEALTEISPEDFEKLEERLKKEGRKAVVVPSKMVYTKKPGQGKLKARWVACGNLEPVQPHESTYSSGADAAALRLLIWAANRFQWETTTVDIKTAFLNANMDQSPEEDLLIIRPPNIFFEKKLFRRGVLFRPDKAVYGFRRSPRLWGKERDSVMSGFVIAVELEGEKGEKVFKLCPLDTEPNLWKVINMEDAEDEKVYGLVMTYVDDIMISAPLKIRDAILSIIRSTWTTSAPENIQEEPVRFLGVEISVHPGGDGRKIHMLPQRAYIQDLTEGMSEKKLPITKEQAIMPLDPEPPSVEQIRKSQKSVGEVLWVSTRTRPEIAFAVSRMGSGVLKATDAVEEADRQLKGYLQRTKEEGLKFEVKEHEEVKLKLFTDASFAPSGTDSHGAFLVMLGSTPIFWRSGRQGLVTLSTAEAELTEIVEGMVAAESISVMVAEIFPDLRKELHTDSTSAISILTADGGSWRTRHLRLRATYTRQAVASSEWTVHHTPGEVMLADVGTKALPSPRVEMLKTLMGMTSLAKFKKEEKKKEGSSTGSEEETEEKGREAKQKRKEVEAKVTQAAQIMRLLVLAALLSEVRSEGEDEEIEVIDLDLVAIYTVIVIVVTLTFDHIWKVAVQLYRLVAQWCTRGPVGSLPGEVEGSEEEEELSRPESLPEVESVVQEPEAPLPENQEGQEPESALNDDELAARIWAELDEIEREEQAIWRDLNSAAPGAIFLDQMNL